MSEDLIRREDAIEALYKYSFVSKDVIEKEINAIPSADRPQGKWIYGEHNVAMCDGYRCNRCDFFVPWDYEHKFIDFINDYHFCPNCGARMKGADDE